MRTAMDEEVTRLSSIAVRAAAIPRGYAGGLIDLAVLSDELGAALKASSVIDAAAEALASLVTDVSVAAVIPASEAAREVTSALKRLVRPEKCGRPVVVALLVATGTEVFRCIDQRGLDASRVLVLTLAASAPVDTLGGVELRVLSPDH